MSIFTFSSKSSSAVIDCLLTDRQKKLTDIGAVFRSISAKDQVLRFSLMNYFPRKNPVLTWTSVFKTMQKFYVKSQKFSRSNSETKKTISQNLSSLQKNFLQTKITFLTALSQKCSPETEKNWHSKSKNISKNKCLLIQLSSRQKDAFSKIVPKIKPIVSYSSAVGLKLFKKFCFLYLKILSSFKIRLVT